MLGKYSVQHAPVLRAVLLLICLGAVLTGPTGAYNATASSVHAASSLIVNLAQAPATLDPAEACGFTDLTVLDQLYVRLTQYGSKPGPNGTTQVDPGKIVPYFAKSWTISKDGLVYTFTLPSGAKFPSGAPMDASAVKYSFDRLVKMAGCGQYFLYDGFYTPPLVKSVATPNATTVVITLSHPDANVLQDWAQPDCAIVDPTVVEANGGVQAGKISTWMAGHSAGGGPYTLQNYQPNVSATLTANPTFYGQQPASGKVILNFINSDATLLLQARSGEADITLGLSKQSAHSLVGNAGVTLVANDLASWEQIGLDNSKPPFNNLKLREALAYAVPYQQILDKVAFGYGKLFYGPFPPALPEFNAALEGAHPYDLAKAQALIQQSGIATPINVQLVIPEGNSIEEQIATVVQGIWGQIGVNVTVTKLAASDYINSLEGHKVQSYTRLDGPGVLEAGYLLAYDMVCKVGFNLSSICVPQADKLIAQGRVTINKAKRQAIWNQVIGLWNADAPKIPVYADQSVTVLNKRVTHYFFSHEIDLRTWAK